MNDATPPASQRIAAPDAPKWQSQAGALRRPAILAVSALAIVIAVTIGSRMSETADSAQGAANQAERADIVDRYCSECHNSIDWDGGLAFEVADDDVQPMSTGDETSSALWERAIRKVRAGMMPPADSTQPPADVLQRFVHGLEARLDADARRDPDPGRESLSRLNRTEYTNAIRDILAYDATAVVESLPADEVVGGFDNIGDSLSVSPTLIERYVSAAMTVAREAVGDREAIATQRRYDIPSGLDQNRHIDGLPLGTRGGVRFAHTFPLDATYEIRIARIRPPGIATQRFCPPAAVSLSLDGRRLDTQRADVVRLPVTAGPHTIAAALTDTVRCAGVNELHDSYRVNDGIRHVEIHGPFESAGPGDTPSRQRIFSCHPRTPVDELPCAEEILTRLASDAYRRPLTASSPAVAPLIDFYRRTRENADFESGIEGGIARLLMSPQFLFQFEREPAGIRPDTPYRLSDLELATRLSFFLWSSVPDRDLRELAAAGDLTDPATLERTIDRMLDDERAEALTTNFGDQWLSLRELREALPQDPAFDANLRDALEAETQLLFADIARDNRPVLELLTADYTYLNDRLARHYGVEGINGSYMRAVTLPADSPRRGLLGHGSWLTATSVADRTSPVIRGEWFMTHLLGAPVPEPPPGVEADLSDEADAARANDTLRERLERHRANPNCASCHRIMDPIGLALENFDLIGRWRDTENGRPIDTTGTLMDGTPIDHVDDLREMLQTRSTLFVTALTEKLLSYAIGRVTDHRDMPAVRAIVDQAAGDGYRFRSLVRGIVASEPFQMRMSAPEGAALTAMEESR